MDKALWSEVDHGLATWLLRSDDALQTTLQVSEAEGLPSIQVSPLQGQWLQVLTRAIRARRVLEVGTLAGYSTLWLARALPDDGKVLTLEINPHHAAVAQRNFDSAGMSARISIRIGAALDSLDQLIRDKVEPFDLTFIDADKEQCSEYVERAICLSRPGSTIIVDNVIRDGQVLDSTSDDERVRGVRRMLDMMRDNPSVTTSVLQTVGCKGYDGFLMAVVDGLKA